MKRKPQTAEDRKLSQQRSEWLFNQRTCFNPGCCNHPTEVHEIIGGQSDRHKTKRLVSFWLALCSRCHSRLGSRPNQESLIRQLAVKQWADPDEIDPAAVIRLWRPSCTQEFLAEMLNAVAEQYAIIKRDWTQ